MHNHVTLLGRPAQDIELRTTPGGKAVVSFDLAVPSENRDAPPDYIQIECWEEKAEFANRYLAKGRQILVEGRVKTRKYTDKNGKNRKDTYVRASNFYFADSKNGGGGNGDGFQSGNYTVIEGNDNNPFIGDNDALPFG